MVEIVVGVDNSLGAARALECALDEAGRRGARLRVVHAWRTPQFNAPMGVPYPMITDRAALEADARRVADEALNKALASRPDGLSVDAVAQIVEGDPAERLLEFSDTADMVVVGSGGAGGFARIVLGSVSTKVVHHAQCPVVVVPARSTHPA